MHLWTKAVVLLIVTNSMASSDQSNGLQNSTHLRERREACDLFIEVKINECLPKKWPDDDPGKAATAGCCKKADSACMAMTYWKDNSCPGDTSKLQSNYKELRKECSHEDCKPLMKAGECSQFKCSSGHKVMAQTLALIVVSFVTIFVFF